MKMPEIDALIEWRLLVNYRVDADVAARLLPASFRPQLVDGWAVAGICAMRLARTRPRGVPAFLGRNSVNAAHRIAVEWDGPDGATTGVYIPRRDTASTLNRVVGGRFFPGVYQQARFTARETGDDLHVTFDSADGSAAVDVKVAAASDLESSLLFADVAQASEFFRKGSVGYSATRDGDCLDGMEVRTDAWEVEPVRVLAARSTYFEDSSSFPAGSATLDCALLMRDVPVTWHALSPMRSAQLAAVTAS
ncbi:MAG: DUF2071 domain-containing protein [Actinomycetota bacterium]|nr:DUF2071 domain-containing protein [Actinomycetota bacterium]